MIQVRITGHERREFMNPADEHKYILHRLQNARVPVLGSALFVGLQRGKLTVENSEGDLLFTWKDNG